MEYDPAFANCQIEFNQKSLHQVPTRVDPEKVNGKSSFIGVLLDITFGSFVLWVNHIVEQESSLEHTIIRNYLEPLSI